MRWLLLNDDYLGYGSILFKEIKKTNYIKHLKFSNRSLLFKLIPSLIYSYRYKKLVNKLNKERYDVIFFLCGNLFFQEKFFKKLKKKFPKIIFVTWLYDSLNKFNKFDLSYFDYIFTFDESDCNYLSINGYNSFFLPLFFDQDIYFNRNDDRSIHFVFIGAWHGKYYQSRRKVLEECAIYCKENNFKFIIIGPYGWKSPIKYIRDKISGSSFIKFINPGPISHHDASLLYSKAKIVINIAADNQNNSIPMRFYEALSSGCVLLNNSSSLISNLIHKHSLQSNLVTADEYACFDKAILKSKKQNEVNLEDLSIESRVISIIKAIES